nr:hypothetical protein Iba_chr13aCG4730 [Ipomoea batatas]GMD77971.1 hypothetical protein Iba_chr13cCG8480 [Ipomoea batatas]GMD82046.1 hypothetical protein Iba_chr13fCG4270 [Ipomoea batatas]
MRSPLGANRRDLSAILLTIMSRLSLADPSGFPPYTSLPIQSVSKRKKGNHAIQLRHVTSNKIHMDLGRSLRAPNISPKNGNFDFSVGNFSSSGSSASSTSFDNSCSLTVLKARVVTDSSRAAEMKKQLFRLAQ